MCNYKVHFVKNISKRTAYQSSGESGTRKQPGQNFELKVLNGKKLIIAGSLGPERQSSRVPGLNVRAAGSLSHVK